MDKYIIASCKLWHKSSFDLVAKKYPDLFVWIQSPEELSLVLRECSPRYVFFIHWSWIVPESILSHYECICFHMTDVPYGRGGSPLQNLIIRGHKETKLTALKMTKELDAGPVYIKKKLELLGRAEDIYKDAGRLSFEIIEWIIENEPLPMPQFGPETVFGRRKPEQSAIPRSISKLDEIYDYIRMLDAETYPHAFIDYANFKLEFVDAQILDGYVTAQVVITQKKESGN